MAKADLTVTVAVNPTVLEHDPEDGCNGRGGQCPLAACVPDYDGGEWHCAGTGDEERDLSYISWDPAPEWCPIRQHPVIVCRPGAVDLVP